MLAEAYRRLKARLEALTETLEILRDPETMAALRESLEDEQAERVHAWEDVQRELRL